MSKCKRNIFLIIGYLLVMVICFLPCTQISNTIKGDIVVGANKLVFVPFYIRSIHQYRRLEGWFLDYMIKYRLNLAGIEGSQTVIKEQMKMMEVFKANSDSVNFFGNLISEENKKINEYNKKMAIYESEYLSKVEGSELSYFALRVKTLITEIAAILLIGGFAYILFCVVLKKEEK